MISLAEQATIAFYQWEARGRGYLLFDSPVPIEPPYVPFIPVIASQEEYVDDGKVPSLLGRIKRLVEPAKETSGELELPEIIPRTEHRSGELKCFSLAFPKETEISPELSRELINLLCYSDEAFSFEILAQQGSIQVQFAASETDSLRLNSQLKAYFPKAIIKPVAWDNLDFDVEKPVAIADFGLDNEFMLPSEGLDTFNIDPLTSIIATLSSIEYIEVALLQVIFKGVTAPWGQDAIYASSDGRGGSFFEGYPEFIKGVQDKVSHPLFGVVLRIAVQGGDEDRSRYIASELAKNITSVSTSEYNRLIPLSNEGYPYEDHFRNVVHRTTNRLGFILNSKELSQFIHYPNKTVVNPRLGIGNEKTKRGSDISGEGIYIGKNEHHGESYPVTLETETRLSHTHIIGATGVGKSTLIANMMLADIDAGRGCAIFDPHGDICDDILKRIPEHRINDVIIIDPADSEFPIGFNLLEATTEAEKIVLASDLVSSFKRHATAWGDNMTAVLQNAVATILESSKGGTLIELKRFLIEEKYRSEYLKSVEDPSLHYYWNHEYLMVRKGIAPLLTRIDTFLRPKLVRYMLAQKSGIDVGGCLNDNKVILLKLSQGLIGESNSFLLGSLFLAKFNQAALARQNIDKAERQPYMLYLDEFQNFITPSVERILSGARKYGLGITIAHQELGQIQDSSLVSSVLSNPKIRICFRLGDMDAKRLESGFSYFEQADLQNLERGQAIVRIGSRNNDFNLSTRPLNPVGEDLSEYIIEQTRKKYGTHGDLIESLLRSMLPNIPRRLDSKKDSDVVNIQNEESSVISEHSKESSQIKEERVEDYSIETQKEEYIERAKEEEVLRKHRSLQYFARTLGIQRGMKATLEKEGSSGGKIDVVLENENLKIAIEIAVTNTVDYELENIKKCVDSGYTNIVVISEDAKHLNKIQDGYKKNKGVSVRFIHPNQFAQLLTKLLPNIAKDEKRVRGYRVKTNYNLKDDEGKKKSITDIIMQSLRKKKK